MRYRPSFIACLFGLLLVLDGRELRAESGAQVWGAVFLQAKLSEVVPGLHAWLDLQPRHGAGGAVTLVRPGLGLQLTDGLILHAGYAWVARWPEAEPDVHEHRIWQQLLFTHTAGETWDLLLRPRFEQRLSARGGAVGLRLRFMARAAWWLERDGPLALVAWDEVFLGFNQTDWGNLGGFDQNRLFLGVAIRGVHRSRFELGYLNLYLGRGAAEDRVDHVASLNLFASF